MKTRPNAYDQDSLTRHDEFARVVRRRLSEKLEICLPDEVGCRRLLARHLAGVRLAEGLLEEELANRLHGISPADLDAVCSSAKRMAMRRMPHNADELPPLTLEDFVEALKRVQVRV